MKKFIVLYSAQASWKEDMKDKSEEDMKKGMEAWMAWSKKCGSGLVDMGAPLGNGQKVTKTNSANSESKIIGYSVLQAEDIDGAKKLLEGHPHLEWNDSCSIEVFEAMPMPN